MDLVEDYAVNPSRVIFCCLRYEFLKTEILLIYVCKFGNISNGEAVVSIGMVIAVIVAVIVTDSMEPLFWLVFIPFGFQAKRLFNNKKKCDCDKKDNY